MVSYEKPRTYRTEEALCSRPACEPRRFRLQSGRMPRLHKHRLAEAKTVQV